ncbi:MAG: hypothetical protein HY644_06750 [Acidobacteria bacterium]|nr:hypothetical protein [Acidobacteriota bacterium]
MKIKKSLIAGLLMLLIPAVSLPVMADSVTLRDGRTYMGTYIGGTSRTIRFRTEGVTKTFRIAEVGQLNFGSAVTATAGMSSSDQYGSHSGTHSDTRSGVHSGTHVGPYSTDTTSSGYPRVAVRDEYVIPSGTVLRVRTNELIDSDNARVGDTYSATLDQNVILNGQLLAERGSPAKLRIAEMEEAGTFTGRTILVIDLVEMTVGSSPYALSTTQVEERGGSQGKRTGAAVGGGAALGGIIGAIAGGGKGAAIGAAVGGASGAGYQILIKGEKLKIPAETILEFTLQQDLFLHR